MNFPAYKLNTTFTNGFVKVQYVEITSPTDT